MRKNKEKSICFLMSLEDHISSFVPVTEQAALACYPMIGKKDSMGADQQAVSAMREAFNKLAMDVRIVIGEGERDKAPRLYSGEKLGDPNASLKIDVAVDPLEGTTLCAEARAGALSVMAIALRGNLLKAPDVYMDKMACGPVAKDSIDLKKGVKQNIEDVAKALGKSPREITVGLLDRPRHKKLIQEIKETGAKIKLVGDGDLSLAIETSLDFSPIDLLLGSGGAPEGVLAAGALKCLGGGFQGQLIYKNEGERVRAKALGVQDLDKIWSRDELAGGEVLFCATGVTSGNLIEGVKKEGESYSTETLVLSLKGQKKIKNSHSKTF